jgi:hypothetical protein
MFASEIPFASILPLNKEYDEICADFTAKMKSDICISEVYKINNPKLVINYEACKAEISAKRGKSPEEILVYHGTTYEASCNISTTGFLSSYSNINAYGIGTYASIDPKMALIYCKDAITIDDFSFIFVCKFLKGTYKRVGTGEIIDTSLYDYSGLIDDRILVTPYDSGILPIYLLRYYKFA